MADRDASLDVRRTPCASCPYRRDVPSGVWARDEYERLPKWDGEIADQAIQGAFGLFLCHQNGEDLCAGWVGHREEPADLLALRLAMSRGEVESAVIRFETSVPLFESGAAARDHGVRDVDAPSPAAVAASLKITRKRELQP